MTPLIGGILLVAYTAALVAVYSIGYATGYGYGQLDERARARRRQ